MAVVNAALCHKRIIDHLIIHVCQERLLIMKECLERFRVQFSAASLRIPHCLELIANSFFEYLKAILTELVVQFRQIRDWADSGKHGVVPKGVAFGTEGCHHRDPLLRSESA